MLEIKKLDRDMELSLIGFFSDVAKGDYARYYYPYDFTPESAKELCNLSGKDLHYVLTDSLQDRILGHGMLRGWDEGYDIPSLGIIIHPDFTNRGLGTWFVNFLHSVAWTKGCSKIRLRVHKDNIAAFNIYKKLGYIFTPGENEEFIGILSRGRL